jgi:hypothetical protein
MILFEVCLEESKTNVALLRLACYRCRVGIVANIYYKIARQSIVIVWNILNFCVDV